MLREDPTARPNIYQVVREVCAMRGTDIPIKDVSIVPCFFGSSLTVQIYTGRSHSEARRNQHLPTPESSVATPPTAGAFKAPIVEEKSVIPDIVPMRRGRPTKDEPNPRAPKPSPSPLRASNGDPFGALDAPSQSFGDQAAFDDVSNRFPPLDQFSLLHDSGSKFAFDAKSKPSKSPQDINQRVANALADEAFAQSAPSSKTLPNRTESEEKAPLGPANGKSTYSDSKSTPKVEVQSTVPETPKMVSTGTMTSPSLPESTSENINLPSRPIFKFPPSPVHRSLSQPRASDAARIAAASLRAGATTQKRPGLLDHRSKSQVITLDAPRSPASSRPSLEGQRPSKLDLDNSINRSKSTTSRTRPVSDHFGSNIGVRPNPDLSGRQSPIDGYPDRFESAERPVASIAVDADSEEAKKIDSNVDFLRAMEEEDPSRKKHHRSSSGSKHAKRASMPSISLSGTKNLFAGRFGEAFRRFESTTSGSGPRSPSPSPNRGVGELTPIAGSEATDGRSDDGNVLEETEVPPEVRRELERRRLSQEEKRVTDAAAAYRQRMARGGIGSRGRPMGELNSRATSIQNKVKSLLDESGRVSPSKTAEGYGRFTEPSTTPQQTEISRPASLPQIQDRQSSRVPPPSSRNVQPVRHSPLALKNPTTDIGIAKVAMMLPDRTSSRPSAPPKPQALRTGAREEQQPSSPLKPLNLTGKALPQPPRELTTSETDEWEANFSKKYPSLAGLEMVETEIDKRAKGASAGLRTRDV